MSVSKHWEVLGLTEPTRDKKSVKRAYAIQLKKHRPDEDPEGFKTLRKAYEFALAFVENAEGEEDSSFEWRELDDVLVKGDSVKGDLLESVDTSQIKNEIAIVEDDGIELHEEERLKIIERKILTQVEKLLESPIDANDPANWSFISDSPELFNSEFNWNLGVKVFARLNDLIPKHFILKEGVPLPINLEVILYLDGLFNWINQSDDLQYQLDSEDFTVLFRILAFSEDYAHLNRGHGVKGGQVVGDQDAQTGIQSVGGMFFKVAGLIAVVFVLAKIYVG